VIAATMSAADRTYRALRLETNLGEKLVLLR
jgi:hypothetical protein